MQQFVPRALLNLLHVLQLGLRPFDFTLRAKDLCQAVVGVGAFRVEVDRLLKLRSGLIIFLLLGR